MGSFKSTSVGSVWLGVKVKLSCPVVDCRLAAEPQAHPQTRRTPWSLEMLGSTKSARCQIKRQTPDRAVPGMEKGGWIGREGEGRLQFAVSQQTVDAFLASRHQHGSCINYLRPPPTS